MLLSPSAAGQLPPALLGKHDARCSELCSSSTGRRRGRDDRQDSAAALGREQSLQNSNSKSEVREIKVKAAKETGRENSDKCMFLGFSKGLLEVSALMYPSVAGCAQLNNLWHLQSGG